MTWRKRLAVWRNRLYLYPPPEPLPRTRAYWLATGLVALLVVLFASYFILYLTGRQDAYMTNAEDLGIMDQALWTTVHGQLLHQTICNIVSDTNCYSFNGISRFAIHFEPILFLVSLLYLLWSDPKTLQVVQTLVVASGAFPAFWLARLRLRNEWAAAGIALLYLLYPAQQNAVIFDFHAVTFTAALLLYTLYFMYTRRTVWLFVFAILAMACKEEIPVVVACFGLWSMLFQQRWCSGLLLVLLAIAWIGLGLLVVHLYSPSGHSLLASRYTYLGSNPLQIARTVLMHPIGMLKQHVLERDHRTYLGSLLAPAGYLPLLAPWVLLLALPTLALNLLSSDPQMYSGIFQYNAEIVPVLIFSSIEALVLILWLAQWCFKHFQIHAAQSPVDIIQRAHFAGKQPEELGKGSSHVMVAPRHPVGRDTSGDEAKPRSSGMVPWSRWVHVGLLALLMVCLLASVLHEDISYSGMPFARGFRWPHATTHTQLAEQFLDMLPPTASVSAQSRLVPHLSQRLNIYMFPYADDRADYILLDVNGDRYPYSNAQAYSKEVKKVLLSGNYGILAAESGYLLLKRGLSPPGTVFFAFLEEASTLPTFTGAYM